MSSPELDFCFANGCPPPPHTKVCRVGSNEIDLSTHFFGPCLVHTPAPPPPPHNTTSQRRRDLRHSDAPPAGGVAQQQPPPPRNARTRVFSRAHRPVYRCRPSWQSRVNATLLRGHAAAAGAPGAVPPPTTQRPPAYPRPHTPQLCIGRPLQAGHCVPGWRGHTVPTILAAAGQA